MGYSAGRDRRDFAQHGQNDALGKDRGDDGHEFACSLFRTGAAIALDLFRESVPRSRRKSLAFEKLWCVRDGEYARDAPASRFEQREFNEPSAQAFAAPFRTDCDRANFGEIGAITFQRKAADDMVIFFQNQEMAYIPADFFLRARQ